MIKDKILARRYGEAFIAFTKDTIGVNKALEDLKNLRNSVINGNP